VMPACVGGMSTRITRRSIAFKSDAERLCRSTFIVIANEQWPMEVSCESDAKR
jgi:hypothetical protein